MERKQIANLNIAMKDLEPYVKNPKFLTQGVRLTNFNMLVREAWANILLCIVLRKITGHEYTFQEEESGDGVIFNKTDATSFGVEHVCAMDYPAGKQLPKGDARIIWAIDHKIARGADYAKDKALVVFFDGAEMFTRQKIRENIYRRHGFKAVFIIGLLEVVDSKYSYLVTEFRDSFGDKSHSYRVDINKDFNDWKITQIMQ